MLRSKTRLTSLTLVVMALVLTVIAAGCVVPTAAPQTVVETVVVKEEVEVVKFDAEKLRKLAQSKPEFGRELAMRVGQVVLQRLHFTRLQLMDFYSTKPRSKQEE